MLTGLRKVAVFSKMSGKDWIKRPAYYIKGSYDDKDNSYHLRIRKYYHVGDKKESVFEFDIDAQELNDFLNILKCASFQ